MIFIYSPQPFDLTLNLNLTSPCLDYFAYFLSSLEFKACRPFSLLASSSSAFSTLASTDNLTAITAVVQATLNTSSTVWERRSRIDARATSPTECR
jgi:hypothetical protein